MRKAKKVTQSELAQMTGSKQQVISRIEKKENSPSLRSYCNMLSALGYELQIGERKIFCVYGKNSSLIRNRYV